MKVKYYWVTRYCYNLSRKQRPRQEDIRIYIQSNIFVTRHYIFRSFGQGPGDNLSRKQGPRKEDSCLHFPREYWRLPGYRQGKVMINVAERLVEI